MANMRINVKRVPSEVMYLIVIDQMLKKYKDLVLERPTDKFDQMVREVVMNHVIDGKEPPKQIRTAVMNVADDMMAGRDVTLRAGDYITLMEYARENKLL
jgi:uncharacterized protein (UPF0147 family)